MQRFALGRQHGRSRPAHQHYPTFRRDLGHHPLRDLHQIGLSQARDRYGERRTGTGLRGPRDERPG